MEQNSACKQVPVDKRTMSKRQSQQACAPYDGPIDSYKDKVQQHSGNDDNDDVLEGLLEQALVRRAQLDPHNHDERPVVQQAHRHPVVGHPPGQWGDELPDDLRRTGTHMRSDSCPRLQSTLLQAVMHEQPLSVTLLRPLRDLRLACL